MYAVLMNYTEGGFFFLRIRMGRIWKDVKDLDVSAFTLGYLTSFISFCILPILILNTTQARHYRLITRRANRFVNDIEPIFRLLGVR
jgi:hypothetical protein